MLRISKHHFLFTILLVILLVVESYAQNPESVLVTPDTLFFLDLDDFFYGQDFKIKNVSTDTVIVESFIHTQNWGYDFVDSLDNFIVLPQEIPPEDSMMVTVMPGIPTNSIFSSLHLLTDTLFVVMDVGISDVIIILDHHVVSVETDNHNTRLIMQPVLAQNYPNPFNASTRIIYSIPSSDFVSLKVYDLLGREINTLVNKFQIAGTHSVSFDADGLVSGFYFYRLQMANFVATKIMLLMK